MENRLIEWFNDWLSFVESSELKKMPNGFNGSVAHSLKDAPDNAVFSIYQFFVFFLCIAWETSYGWRLSKNDVRGSFLPLKLFFSCNQGDPLSLHTCFPISYLLPKMFLECQRFSQEISRFLAFILFINEEKRVNSLIYAIKIRKKKLGLNEKKLERQISSESLIIKLIILENKWPFGRNNS